MSPGCRYDLDYVIKDLANCNSYNYNHIENMCKIEKKYDNLAIIRLHKIPQQWVIRIKEDLQELHSRERPKHISYRRPKIHKSQIAICFKCWRLVKINEVKPKRVYWEEWHRWDYEIKSKDLMQYHWDNECFKANIQDKSIQIIQNIIPIESIKIKSFTSSLINEPHLLTPLPLPPKPFEYI
ncbi:2951_t:CDS:2 [Racocetra persica]|uniref:2951_t:CDS:1 n=1 Tax=Racocetra persica TaxID=160502 RepID=A0ACA9RAQ0_9GLOM|nr:2951_t:CDS:2 [Racocetra persica]